MRKDKTSQCCVISGESGAGKSETCKLLVQHLARVTGSEEANLNNKINQVIVQSIVTGSEEVNLNNKINQVIIQSIVTGNEVAHYFCKMNICI